MTDSITIDTPAGVTAYHLLAWKYAIKLEAKGLKHSSGKSVRVHAARYFGLSPRTPALQVIQLIDKELKRLEDIIKGSYS